MGNIRDADYDLKVLIARQYDSFADAHPPKNCHCDWGCGQNVAVVTHPKFWFGALSGQKKDATPS